MTLQDTAETPLRQRRTLRKYETSPWTAERIEVVRENWGKLCCAAIADLLGGGISKCGVIGKARRMGLEQLKEPGKRGQQKPRKRSEVKLRVGDRGWQAKPRLEVVEPIPVMDDSSIPLEQRKQIDELEEHHCRFPCGSPDLPGSFFFCGAIADGGRSYCRAHHARCYSGFGRVHV